MTLTIDWQVEWDEDTYKTFYSGDPKTCDFFAAWHGASPHRNKWGVYKRAPCGRFGNHIDPATPRYASLADVEAAISKFRGEQYARG